VQGDEHKRTGTWRKWAFVAVPAAGLLELGAHVVQTHSVVAGADWQSARAYVASHVAPEDLVAFAPGWVDPIGRQEFGPGLATLQREARPDETRFPRAFEVSIRGGSDAALAAWHKTDEQRFGAVTVTTLENPAPVHVLDDLVSFVGPQRMQVSRVEGDRTAECTFTHAATQSGGLGSGPAIPADRFVCPGGGFVGASVAANLDYRPHRCIYAPPGPRGIVRVRFLGVTLGQAIHGHHGLYVEAERGRAGAPVTLTFRVGDTVVGSVVHNDGDGWKPFEFDTSELAGEAARTNGGRADIVADIASPGGERRMYCFEADTR
jgi:hypothetical protein